MLTAIENQLISFAQNQTQSLDAVTAGPLMAMNCLISAGQDPDDLTKQVFSLSPTGTAAMQAAFVKLQSFAATSDAAGATLPAIEPTLTVGQTTEPGSGDTNQIPLVPMNPTPEPTTVGEDPFKLIPMVPEKEKGRTVGQTIYPFDKPDFLVGMGFIVEADSNSDEDLKAVRDKMKNAAAGANRRHREDIPGETKEVTKTRKVQKNGKDVIDPETQKPKREKYKENVPKTRQTRKFTTEPLEPTENSPGGVKVMRVEP